MNTEMTKITSKKSDRAAADIQSEYAAFGTAFGADIGVLVRG